MNGGSGGMPGGQEWQAEWTPATSAPGELYTVEGQIRAVGVRAPRGGRRTREQQQMKRIGWWLVALAGAVIGLAVLADIIF